MLPLKADMQDYGRSLIGTRLSEKGDFLIVASEHEGSEVRRWYRLADLHPSASNWNSLEYEPDTVTTPAKQEVFKWKNELPVLAKEEGTHAYLFWAIDQLPEPPYPEVPARISTIVLYITVPLSVLDPTPDDKTWRVAQYYSDKNGPCAPARNFLTLRNPALSPNDADEHGIPIICMSFNHFGWVEEADSGSAKTRSLKLVTFPDPGTTYEGDLVYCARTLDVPLEVLNEAYHMLIDPTQGLVIVATVDQVLHVYRY